MRWVGELAIARTLLRYQDGRYWWTNIPQDRWCWSQDAELYKMLEEIWSDPFGDRRQEIVFIGTGINKSIIRQQLDSCLLTDIEIKSGWKSWIKLPDPFPEWNAEQL